MPVVGETSGERRAVVEREHGTSFGTSKGGLEGIGAAPELEDFLLLLGKVEVLREFRHAKKINQVA